MWKPAVSGLGNVRIRTILSYWRIRRYLVLLFKTAEKHVTLAMWGSVRPARTLFLKVKVLSVPVSGKRIVNMARVSTVKWNLKEAWGKPLVRRTEIMYKAYSLDKTAEQVEVR